MKLLFKDWLLAEMPLNLQLLGRWGPQDRPHRWDRPSIGILTSPVGVEKIKAKWAKVPQQINAWMMRGPKASKVSEVGEVNYTYLQNTLRLKVVENPQAPDEISIDPHAINIVFTQNVGVEKMPMNYWTMAHRLGHALKNTPAYKYFWSELNKGLFELTELIFGQRPRQHPEYLTVTPEHENFLRRFAEAIGTMNSARKGWLRNYYEFGYELLAQKIATGKVKFNPFPRKVVEKYAWGRPQYRYYTTRSDYDFEYAEERLQGIASEADYNLDYLLSSSQGKILVM